MFGPQHTLEGQSCLRWAQKAPGVSPAACNTSTCAEMAKVNHVCANMAKIARINHVCWGMLQAKHD
jgi:hypothetical protein